MDMEKTDNQKKSDVQDEILLAALTLFAEQGYFNTSLTDIKDKAGLKSTSGIYQHFKNKQIIANTLYSKILDSLSISPEIEGKLIVREYFTNINEIYSISDLIISRAGAGSIKEITTLGIPSILIPKIDLPGDHQILNFRVNKLLFWE